MLPTAGPAGGSAADSARSRPVPCDGRIRSSRVMAQERALRRSNLPPAAADRSSTLDRSPDRSLWGQARCDPATEHAGVDAVFAGMSSITRRLLGLAFVGRRAPSIDKRRREGLSRWGWNLSGRVQQRVLGEHRGWSGGLFVLARNGAGASPAKQGTQVEVVSLKTAQLMNCFVAGAGSGNQRAG